MKYLDKKILTKKVKTIEDAKAFIDELCRCEKMFHFDDDPCDVECFTPLEAHYVTLRMDEVMYNDEFDWGEHQDAYGYGLYKLNINI